MFKRFLALTLFALASFPAPGYGEDIWDAIDEKMTLPLAGYNTTLGGVIAGLGGWLQRHYTFCTDSNTYADSFIAMGSPETAGCFIAYGPRDEKNLLLWAIDAGAWDGYSEGIKFGYEFLYDGQQFVLRKFNYRTLKIDADGARAMFQEIVNSKEAKSFMQKRD